MSLQASKTLLSAASKKLSANWNQTKDYWRDDKSHQFEQKYLDEFLSGVDAALEAITKLDKLLAAVRQDCE